VLLVKVDVRLFLSVVATPLIVRTAILSRCGDTRP